jgi:hypothetical protein
MKFNKLANLQEGTLSSIFYTYKSETGWLTFYLCTFVCVLLGDGGLLLCSGGRFHFGQF